VSGKGDRIGFHDYEIGTTQVQHGGIFAHGRTNRN
jgi:hypothetical protein